MKYLVLLSVIGIAVSSASCRPKVEEVISTPTEAELSAALAAVNAEVEGHSHQAEPLNPNILGHAVYRYQVEALLDGNFELQCQGIAKGEALRDLGVNFQETSECSGSILTWVLDLNRYLPPPAETSPLTLDYKIMPYSLNLASISTKDLGMHTTMSLVRHVNLGEFEIYRQPCPQGFCEKFEKMKNLLNYWVVKRTGKSSDGLREGNFLAAYSRKNGTAVLLKTVFLGTYQIADSAFSVPLRISIEIENMPDVRSE